MPPSTEGLHEELYVHNKALSKPRYLEVKHRHLE